STVRVNQFQMGVVAVNRLLDMVEKPSHHERQAPSEDVVPVSFMVRESG
ncbi:MAG TPA: LacI family transcriptional regulator, partial [Cutibacterium acnes]|nr:LacI family transcriptional regulator [Cutibacterium acnes]